MKAAILAAGLGTRLRPLTELLPKTLIPILNRPLLGLLLAQVEDAGFLQVAVNTHHLAAQVEEFLAGQPWGFNLSVSQEPEIMGTGGGLRGLGEMLRGGPFLAVNGDILTDLDLAAVYRGHRADAISTLVLHACPPYNNVWVAEGRVVSIGEPPPDFSLEEAGPPLAYTGVQVVGPGMLKYLPAGQPYDLVTAWRQALAAGERLAALVAAPFWQDLGTPAAYLTAHRRLLRGEAPKLSRYFARLTDPWLGVGDLISAGAQFGGGVCLGDRVKIGAGAVLRHTVVWDEATVEPGVRLTDCIVASGVRVNRSARGMVLV
ncbi:MAG: NDP-sugar synthase [Deltaproteobacteria bacterium]|nr:NDP-sugar synthase [Deltaproteobacteria bacterium]